MRPTKLSALLVFAFAFVSTSFSATDFKTVVTAELHSMIVDNAYELEGGRKKPFLIIDSRTREEYNEAHIFSSISIPEGDFEKSMKLLPQDKGMRLVVYCSGTQAKTSRKWAEKAAIAGYTNVVIYSEGFLVWKERKMPIAPL